MLDMDQKKEKINILDMNAQVIYEILSQAKIDKNGRIMNKGKLIDTLHAAHLMEAQNIVTNCALQVPTNWLSPLLTGENPALTGKAGQWGCPDVESLLRAIKANIKNSNN